MLHFSGVLVGLATFCIIGLFHPIVIKAEYHFGKRCWWVFALLGVLFCGLSLLTEGVVLSTILGVVGFSCLWSILELFEQEERVRKGWFPANPNKKKR